MNRIWQDKGFSLAIAWAFNQLAYAIVYPFIPLYLSGERGMPITKVALIFPLVGLAVMLTPPVAGYLTDRIGRGFMMDLGQVARGAIFLLLAFFTWVHAPFWVFAVFLMLNAAVGVFFQVGADTYLADVVPMEKRPICYSKIRIGFNIGWALGPMLGAFFSKTPFWFFFLATAVLCMIGAVFTHFVCKAPLFVKRPMVRKKAVCRRQTEENTLHLIFSSRTLLGLLVGSLLITSLSSQLYSTLSIFSTQRVGISGRELGLIYSMNGFMPVFLQIPVTKFLNHIKLSLNKRLLFGTMPYALGFFILGFAPGAWLIALAVFVLTWGELIINPALYSSFTQESCPENAGRILSSYSLMRGIGYSLGPWLGAQLYEHIASSVLLWGHLSAFGILAALVFWSIRKNQKNITNFS